MRKNKLINFITLFFIFFCIVSCGRKRWPTPVAEEDKCSFTRVEVVSNGKCLEIKGILKGNIYNLKQIILELETGKICIKCPFRVTKRVIYSLSSPGLRFVKNSLILRYCPEKGEEVVRLRLVGVNKFDILGPFYSKVIILKKNKE